MRTGWLAWYLQLPASDRAQLAGHGDTHGTTQRQLLAPGLQASDEVAEYLWDHGIAAVVSDNPAVEAPRRDEQGARLPADRDLTLHTRLMAMLGIALGELFNLEGLAADCANDGVHEFSFVAAPLHVPGGF